MAFNTENELIEKEKLPEKDAHEELEVRLSNETIKGMSLVSRPIGEARYFMVFRYSFLRAIPKIIKQLFSRLSFVKLT